MVGTPNRASVRSLYIHVPFCFHKCHYCDFYSIVDTRGRQEAFVARLERELAALAPLADGRPLETIFVGGGTPSLLQPVLWKRLLGALRANFDLGDLERGATGGGPGEFTVECNPETVTAELMDILRSGGVGRVSLGAQSFDPAHLKTLERWHEPASVPRALELAARAGIERRSIDLIFAIPGQTLDGWRADLDAALALGVSHLSCYNLTYEHGTALRARLDRGELTPLDEDLELAMYDATLERLARAGLRRYEVSNYARPGQECRHNLAYWRQRDWLAAGPSASGHVGGWRWKNTPRLDDYLERDDAGFAPAVDVESPDQRRAIAEWIMTTLRLDEGTPEREALGRGEAASRGAGERLAHVAASLRARGWLRDEPGRWALSDAGFHVADSAAQLLMEALDEPSGGGPGPR